VETRVETDKQSMPKRCNVTNVGAKIPDSSWGGAGFLRGNSYINESLKCHLLWLQKKLFWKKEGEHAQNYTILTFHTCAP
jgi:hypothetical protein